MYNFLTYRGEAEGNRGVRKVAFHSTQNTFTSSTLFFRRFSTGNTTQQSRLAEILSANRELSPYQQG